MALQLLDFHKSSSDAVRLTLMATVLSIGFLLCSLIVLSFFMPKALLNAWYTIRGFVRFFYVSFVKPHTGDTADDGQQGALESFYKAQVSHLAATSYQCCCKALTEISGGNLRCHALLALAWP